VVALVVALVLFTGGGDESADRNGSGTTSQAEGSGPGGTGDPAGTTGDDPDGNGSATGEGEGEGANGETGTASNSNGGNTSGGGNRPAGGGGGGGGNPDDPAPPEQLNEAYARGYTDVCNEVWSVSDNGMVYDPDDPEYGFEIDECLDYLDDSWGEFEDTIEEAYDAGRAEAELMAESLTFSGLLCNQSLEQCWEVP
jgi:hypothetical protein